MSCAVALDGSGKLVGALGPRQLSAEATVVHQLVVDANINETIILRID